MPSSYFAVMFYAIVFSCSSNTTSLHCYISIIYNNTILFLAMLIYRHIAVLKDCLLRCYMTLLSCNVHRLKLLFYSRIVFSGFILSSYSICATQFTTNRNGGYVHVRICICMCTIYTYIYIYKRTSCNCSTWQEAPPTPFHWVRLLHLTTLGGRRHVQGP